MESLSKNKANLYIVGGLLILFSLITLTTYQAFLPYFYSQKINLPKTVFSPEDKQPTKIEIPGVIAPLTMKAGNYIDGRWDMDKTDAIYLQNTLTASYSANLVVYGHNNNQVMGNLAKVKKDNLVKVTTRSGDEIVYKVDTVKQIFPYQLEILSQESGNRITLYTCAGLLDSMRLVVSGYKV